MKHNQLTDIAIRAAARKAIKTGKTRKIVDGQGLLLLVKPGSLLWRFNYRFESRAQTISMGVFPSVPIALARERRDAARKLVARGINPSAQRRADKTAAQVAQANSFAAVTQEWLNKMARSWVPANAMRIRRLFERDLFGKLGGRPISAIEPAELLGVIQKIERRDAVDTAHRALQACSRVFRFGVAKNYCKTDPARDLRGALAPAKSENFAAIVDPVGVGQLLRAVHGYRGKGRSVVEFALKLQPYLLCRPGELRLAEWSEFDLDSENPVWRIPGSRMKMRDPHVIPLAPQAVALLKELKEISGPRLLFPSVTDPSRPISDNTVNAALRKLGFDGETHAKHVGHGWRAVGSTLLNEMGFAPDVIELCLAHKERSAVRAAYNRAQRLPERRALMVEYANYLDSLRDGKTNVVPFKRREARL